mmetsp:Transcript_10227/g.15475  ORF Transcript_10227/g.15475 Transcript_10227/m.15475 type:complete len:170 (-) Transcript_10227:59-568(-)
MARASTPLNYFRGTAVATETFIVLLKSREEQAISSPRPLSRKQFTSIASSAIATILLLHPVIHPQSANADEPSNLYYKSKADIEDPLVVFGKSLQNLNVVDSPESSSSSITGSTSSDNASLSFSDIALPDASSESPSSPTNNMGGGDLNNALQEKKDSLKRQVDPRTHG